MSFSTADLPSTILLIALGVIIGAAFSKILNKGPSVSELQQKLEESQDQLDQYKQEVDKHFHTTAELVNNLTQSYRAVHEHLSQGAQKLTSHSSNNTLESSQFKALSDSQYSDENHPEEPPHEATPIEEADSSQETESTKNESQEKTS